MCEFCTACVQFLRSGTEEDYGQLQQLLEDISSFNDDCAAAKEAMLANKT